MKTTNTAQSTATARLDEANKSAPFAAYQGWQLDLRALLDKHAQMGAALEEINNAVEWSQRNSKSIPSGVLAAVLRAQAVANAARH